MTFTTVFDAAQMGYSTWRLPAYGLIFVCIGALLVFMPALIQKIMPHGLQGRARRIFSWFFFLFAVIWTLASFTMTYTSYRTVAAALNDRRYSVVEGPVTDFVPMPYGGHALESFVVAGVSFSYSDYIVTSGFHHTASHGGPIRPGIYVRVTYTGSTILRLEIAE